MQTFALFGAKNFGFFEIDGMSAQRRGLKHCRRFSDKVEGRSLFVVLCGLFYERPLSKLHFAFKQTKSTAALSVA